MTEIKSGERFGRLTIISLSHKGKRSRSCYEVKCDCGVSKIVTASNLKLGKTRSCGCLHKDIMKRRAAVVRIGMASRFSSVTASVFDEADDILGSDDTLGIPRPKEYGK